MTVTEISRIESEPISLNCLSQGDAVSESGQHQATGSQTQPPLVRASGAGAPVSGAAPSLNVKPGVEGGGKALGHESHARTIVKSLTWRVGGLIMTVGVAWWITGKGEMAASIGLADTLVKLVVYYVHERMWLKIRFGRPSSTPEYEI